jgi:hypothetical protein
MATLHDCDGRKYITWTILAICCFCSFPVDSDNAYHQYFFFTFSKRIFDNVVVLEFKQLISLDGFDDQNVAVGL